MYVVCVTIDVKPEHLEEFVAATEANYRGTRGEPGNVRFDVSQGEDDPNQFFLYEVYDSRAAFDDHHQTPHYLEWRDKVTNWMARPRVASKYFRRWPADAS